MDERKFVKGRIVHVSEGEKRDRMNRPRAVYHFTHHDIAELEGPLRRVAEINDITWRFTEQGLEIMGLMDRAEDDPVVIGHPRAALAYLEAYCLGYGHGKQDELEECLRERI